MKNGNFTKSLLTLGAVALVTGGANAQYNTNGTNNNAANQGGLKRDPYTNGAGGVYGSPNYANGYGPYSNYYSSSYNPYYGNSFYGNPYYGGGFYDSYYVIGGNNGYASAYGNGSYGSDPYSNANGNNPYGSVQQNAGYNFPPENYYGNNPGYAAPNGAPYATPSNTLPAAPAAAPVLARTTDTLDARRVKGNKFYIGWKGDNNSVSKITFAMLDLNKRSIMTRVVTQAPGEYTFPVTSRMVYYQVVVEYLNGATNTVTSQL